MPLKIPKREAFARLVAGGKPAAAAYRAVYVKAAAATAETEGPALARRPDTALRVRYLRAMAARVAEEELKFEKREALAFLASVVRTPAGQVDPQSKLCQKYVRTRRVRGKGEDAEAWETERVEVPCKISAIREAARMCGWNEPERVEMTLLTPEQHKILDQVFKSSPTSGAAKGKDGK